LAEAEARRKSEGEARIKVAEEARRKAAEEEDARRKASEEARRKEAEDEDRRKAAEEEAHKKALAAEDESRKLAELEKKHQFEEADRRRIEMEEADSALQAGNAVRRKIEVEEQQRREKNSDITERQKVEEDLEASLRLLEVAEETDRQQQAESRSDDSEPKREPIVVELDRAAIENAAAVGLKAQLATQMKGGQSPLKFSNAGGNSSNSVAAQSAVPGPISASKKSALVGPAAAVKAAAFDRQNSGSWLSGKPSTAAEDGDHGDQKPAVQTVNAVAMYDYNHPDQMAREFFSFKAGDIFTILPSERDLQGWKIAVSANGEKGFVPGNYLRYLPTENPEQEAKKDPPAAVPTSASTAVQTTPSQNGNSKPLKATSQGPKEEKVKKDGKKKDDKKDEKKDKEKDKDKKKDKGKGGIFGGKKK